MQVLQAVADCCVASMSIMDQYLLSAMCCKKAWCALFLLFMGQDADPSSQIQVDGTKKIKISPNTT